MTHRPFSKSPCVDASGQIQGYSPKEAIRLCRLCERRGVGLELLEQPVPKWDLAGMAQVRAAADVLIEADVINIKIGKAGGLYQSKKIAAVAEAAGLECVIGTAWGLGVKVAAKLHLAAATRSLRRGVEFTELMLHDLLLAGPQAARPGPAPERRLPQRPLGPGLGVHPRRVQDPHPRTPQAPLTPAVRAQKSVLIYARGDG